MQQEIWQPCPNTNGEYEISSLGSVRRTVFNRRTKSGRNLAHAINPKGYHYVCMSLTTGQKTGWVHRLVCEAFNGAPPTAKHHAAHRNDNKDNNTSSNLYWATPQENSDDRVKNGRALVGSRASGAKLTEADIPKVRELRRAGMLNREIGEMFGLTPHAISQIVHRHKWKHVP